MNVKLWVVLNSVLSSDWRLYRSSLHLRKVLSGNHRTSKSFFSPLIGRQIPEFITFEDRLENSLQRDIVKMEHLRMRTTHEIITSDMIDMELIELKFIFDRSMCFKRPPVQSSLTGDNPAHHDNRDYEILANYQPQSCATFDQQTLLLGKSEGVDIFEDR